MGTPRVADIAVVGAGAAGLMAAIAAGRGAHEQGRTLRILALDGATRLGAKILVAGGGRCNVTHHAVDESAYAGSSPHAIKKVLRSYPVERTIDFFQSLSVELKREETGKLFPTTDSARTVLDALLAEARRVGVELVHPWRVGAVERTDAGFVLSQEGGEGRAHAPRLILATGGMSLPKTGSDGAGYTLVRALGHTLTERVFPALVPMVVGERWMGSELSGLTLPAIVEVRSGTGKRLARFENSTLITHFGLSGPSVLDASRYLTDACARDPAATLIVNWMPGWTPESLDAHLAERGRGGAAEGIARALHALAPDLPDRLARRLCEEAGCEPGAPVRNLSRDGRRSLAQRACGMVIPIERDRGWLFAEVTAGGVPLDQVELRGMESRSCPGLHLCGEILDVDGRIGGFNFQWAWASGHLAGSAAADRLGQ